jgi:hypothetical protein
MNWAKQSPGELRRANTVAICDFHTNRVFVVSHGFSTMGVGPWIKQRIADEYELDVQDIEIVETDQGEYYAAHGDPIAYVAGEYEPDVPMLMAAE